MSPDLLETLEVLTQLVVEDVGHHLGSLAVLDVPLPVEEPVGNLNNRGRFVNATCKKSSTIKKYRVQCHQNRSLSTEYALKDLLLRHHMTLTSNKNVITFETLDYKETRCTFCTSFSQYIMCTLYWRGFCMIVIIFSVSSSVSSPALLERGMSAFLRTMLA